jgi:hypothetical protein
LLIFSRLDTNRLQLINHSSIMDSSGTEEPTGIVKDHLLGETGLASKMEGLRALQEDLSASLKTSPVAEDTLEIEIDRDSTGTHPGNPSDLKEGRNAPHFGDR